MDGALPNVALPTIAQELNIDSASAIMLVSVTQLVLVMALLPMSALGGRIGLRKLYQLGLCLFLASALLCFYAPNFPLLLAARALQALGAAAALSVATALLRSIYPTSRLGRGIGINTVIVASSGGIAPILGGYIVGGALVDTQANRCPDNGAKVDISDCSINPETGSAQLSGLWHDPNFNADHRAFYYARVLENPTCRWSTWDAIRAGVAPRPDLATTLQERAWSSPIHYLAN